ncbi:glycosyltransferase family 2 protein [Candidatus Woesearchaeota archaeon]|nr:glycosyltransferase family 2 protein [Candidatus Woesearchaeota archaeon]
MLSSETEQKSTLKWWYAIANKKRSLKHGKIELSILVPCYNEADNIEKCLRRIPSMPWRTEIIVIDDGSYDDTAKAALKTKVKNLRVIGYKPNRGKGYAVRVGINAARGKFAIILDADMATQPEEIPMVVKPLFDGTADFVNGTRFVYPMEKGSMKALHKPGNRAFALLVSLIIKQYLTDSLCGFKAFKVRQFRGKLKENGWPDFELLIKAKRMNMRILEVPIHYRWRVAGVSKMRTFRHGYSMLKMLAKSLRRDSR